MKKKTLKINPPEIVLIVRRSTHEHENKVV